MIAWRYLSSEQSPIHDMYGFSRPLFNNGTQARALSDLFPISNQNEDLQRATSNAFSLSFTRCGRREPEVPPPAGRSRFASSWEIIWCTRSRRQDSFLTFDIIGMTLYHFWLPWITGKYVDQWREKIPWIGYALRRFTNHFLDRRRSNSKAKVCQRLPS
jgi:hypothetical protein